MATETNSSSVPTWLQMFNDNVPFKSDTISTWLETPAIKVQAFLLLTTVFLFLLGQTKLVPQSRKSKTGRLIPCVQWTRFKLPLLDGIISLIKIRMEGIRLVEKTINEYGPVAICPVALQQLVFVSDVDLIQKILKSTDPLHLSKPNFFYDTVFDNFLKKGLFAADVTLWAIHRKAISAAFTHSSFPTYLEFMNEAARNLVSDGTSLSKTEGKVGNDKMKDLIEHHAEILIAKITMGKECSSFSDEEMNEFYENFRTWKRITIMRFFTPYLLIPFVWRLHPRRKEILAAQDGMLVFASKMINKYRVKKLTNLDQDYKEETSNILDTTEDTYLEEGESETRPFQCLIEKLIIAGMSDMEITDEVGTFMLAGHETIATAIDMLIFHLALNQDIQKKCQEEVDMVSGPLIADSKDGSTVRDLNLDDLSKLKYLERCVMEGLRLSPTIPVYARQMNKSIEVDNGWNLESKDIALIAMWAVHRDPKHWPNPEQFDPDRFLAENVKKRHPYAYIPFSMGRRNCIGWKLAMMEVKVIMAGLIRAFHFTTTDGLYDVKLLFDITLKPERNLNVTFSRRK